MKNPQWIRVAIGIGAAAAVAAVGTVAADQPVAAASGYVEYVAMGDSWTADVAFVPLPVTDQAPADCFQQSYNYPRQVAAALGVATFRDASCGDAQTAHVWSAQSLPLGGTNQPQASRLTPTTDLVTISLGGNDVKMLDVAQGCASLLGLPMAGCAAATNNIIARVPAMEANLVRAIDHIQAVSPNAQVFVVNYLDAIPSTGCWPIVPIANSDMRLVRNAFLELNAGVGRAAAAAGAHFVNLWAQTPGHDVCKGPTVRWVEGLIPLSLNGPALQSPFHPNSAGAAAQASVVLNAIRAVPPITTTTTSTTSTTSTTTSTSTTTTTTVAATTTEPSTTTPVTEPPVTEPPATEPPATEPPATEPPATEPPATEPPPTEQPTTTSAP